MPQVRMGARPEEDDVLCSWCDDPAAFFMVSDRSGAHVDRACEVHMIRWRSVYRRSVRLPAEVRAGTPSPWAGLDEVVRPGVLVGSTTG